MSVKPWVRERVIERDDGVCQWCGLVCPADVDENHPDSATIDHIVPRSAGGSSHELLRFIHRLRPVS